MNLNALMMSANATNFEIGRFLSNSTKTLQGWGGLLITLIGTIMVIYSVYVIAKGVMGANKGQPTNWAVAVIMLILGGAFMIGGFTFVSSIAQSGRQTIENLGSGNGGSGNIILPIVNLLK